MSNPLRNSPPWRPLGVAVAGFCLLTAACGFNAGASPPDQGDGGDVQTAAADAVDAALTEDAMNAVWELYHEEAARVGPGRHPAALRFDQEWHDRLAAAADGAADGEMKSLLLEGASVLFSLGDLTAAATEAVAAADAATDPQQRSVALQQLMSVRRAALLRDPGDAERRAAVAAADRFLAAADAVPEGRRHPMVVLSAVDAARTAAEARGELGDHAGAVADLERALGYREAAAGLGDFAETLPDVTGLKINRAAALVRAERPADAAAAIAEITADSAVAPTLVAFQTAREAGPGGAGGTFLLDWLADNPRDDWTPPVTAALAFALDDAGRDADALPLMVDLRDNHRASLLPMKAGPAGRTPYASLLVRLAGLLRDAGAVGEAAAVADEVRDRFPDDGRLHQLAYSIRKAEEAEAAEAAAAP